MAAAGTECEVHRDTAADVGALIEFFSLQVLDLSPEAAASKLRARPSEIAGVAAT